MFSERMSPKHSSFMVDTWALTELPYHDFGVYVYAMKLHGAFGSYNLLSPHAYRLRAQTSLHKRPESVRVLLVYML